MGRAHRLTHAELADVAVSDRTVWRMVVLTTESGLAGHGEATLDDEEPDFPQLLERAARSLIGNDVDACEVGSALGGIPADLAGRTIRSCLDQAICDLRAQIAGKPVSAFLGGEADAPSIPLYANVNRATVRRSASSFAASAAAAAGEGYRAIKIAPFDGLTPELCGTRDGALLIDAGLERVRAVAEAVPDCALMIDCHWRFTPDAAMSLVDALSEAGIVWLECPLPETADAIAPLKRLRGAANAGGMRLCGLETCGGWDDVRPFVEAGAYDVIMPDVKHAGGLHTILDVAARARAAGVAVSLHNPSGPVAHLFSAHVTAALGGDERMEVQWNESPLFFAITDPPPVLDRGTCRPGRSPGLGAGLKLPTQRRGGSA